MSKEKNKYGIQQLEPLVFLIENKTNETKNVVIGGSPKEFNNENNFGSDEGVIVDLVSVPENSYKKEKTRYAEFVENLDTLKRYPDGEKVYCRGYGIKMIRVSSQNAENFMQSMVFSKYIDHVKRFAIKSKLLKKIITFLANFISKKLASYLYQKFKIQYTHDVRKTFQRKLHIDTFRDVYQQQRDIVEIPYHRLVSEIEMSIFNKDSSFKFKILPNSIIAFSAFLDSIYLNDKLEIIDPSFIKQKEEVIKLTERGGFLQRLTYVFFPKNIKINIISCAIETKHEPLLIRIKHLFW
jgi:hypothetical protein